MNKFFLTLVTSVFFGLTALPSQNQYNDFWNKLINNDRASAALALENVKSETIENLLSEEILRVESGYLEPQPDFLDKFLAYDEAQYYLYAFWNQSFIFDNYISEGFDSRFFETLGKVLKYKFKSVDLNDALTYLKAVEARHFNNLQGYNDYNSKINSIKQWQYCGAFENLNQSGLDKVYEPEIKAKSKSEFNAKSNGKLNWYKSNNTTDAYRFYSNHSEYGSAVHYAQSFVTLEESKAVIFRLGTGSAVKLFVNDVEVFKYDKDVNTELNSFEIQLQLPKGNNRILVKNSESNSTAYFILALFDEFKKPLNYQVSSNYKPYKKSQLSDLNPKILENEFEVYFKNKMKASPSNFLYRFSLYNTYLRNSKYNEARDLIYPLLESSAKSSLLRRLLMITHKLEGNNTRVNELEGNIEKDDPDYFLPVLSKILDYGKLSKLNMTDFEDYINKLKSTFKSDFIKEAANFIYYARQQDVTNLRTSLDRLSKLTQNNNNLILKYAPLYDNIFKEKEKTIAILEKVVNSTFDIKAENMLIRYYDDNNLKKKTLGLLKKNYKYLNTDNYYIERIVKKLHSYKNFNESIDYIDQMLKNYPYSFKAMELRGDAAKQLGDKATALTFYRKALKHYSNNKSLRQKIEDLEGKDKLLDKIVIADAYDFIKDHRNKIESNNYGFNILLDDSNIELFEEGGFRYRYTYIYEITSDVGIDTFKEYNLGLTGDFSFNKAELIKPDGSISPADRSGSNLVFNSISIGDVIYIDYEGITSTSGRFYKDISDKLQFNTFHPVVKNSVEILVPQSRQLYYSFENGDLEPEVSTLDNYRLYKWEKDNLEVLPYGEDYMPNNVDHVGYLHFSTIEKWNDIALWYSDLVRTNIEINADVQSVFNDLFPDGIENLDDDTKAKIIYNYITGDFNYSHVSFRQSGFIPQKPAKTITTKLGDCKDFSTLFVTLSKMAKLDANLVLILTSDYGRKNLVLPSTDFNHCIVKVTINGKPQFLELTDKYLPYKTLPVTLRGATGLEIPFDAESSTSDAKLFHLDEVNRLQSYVINDIQVDFNNDGMQLDIASKLRGHNVSYYKSLLTDPNQTVIENNILEDYKGKLDEDFTLNSVSNIHISKAEDLVAYQTDMDINKKLNSIGSIKIFQLPIVSHPYENSIIQLDKRAYPIDYVQYETVDNYSTTYTIKIGKDESFVEIPQNLDLSYKKHSYSINYEEIQPNELKVTISCHTDYESILPKNYKEYKAYVKTILEAQEAYIGFK